MEYIKIRNWEKYQHYSQRHPPWIKLHNQILDDYEYCCLQDDSKLLLISLFLLASKTENRIPADHDWIKSKAMLKGKIDLSTLIKSNFIEQLPNCLQDDSKPIALCKQNGGTEKRRVEKIREDTDKKKKRIKKVFIPPVIDDFISYFLKNNYPETLARKVFEYYSTADWHDSKGNKVQNWKQKVQGVWFKDENKSKEITYESVEQ